MRHAREYIRRRIEEGNGRPSMPGFVNLELYVKVAGLTIQTSASNEHRLEIDSRRCVACKLQALAESDRTGKTQPQAPVFSI